MAVLKCQFCGSEFEAHRNTKYCEICKAEVFTTKKEKHKNTRDSMAWYKNIVDGLRNGKYHGPPDVNLRINRLERSGGRWK